MGVLAVMLGLLIPAVGNFGRANLLTTAGNQASGIVNFARENSMSRNVMTAVALLTDTGAAEDRRAFAVLELRPGTNDWQPVTKWQVLPEGTLVDEASSFVTGSLSRLPFANTSNLPLDFRGETVTGGQFAARVFLPSGGLSTPDEPARISVVEGTNSAAGESALTRPDGAGSANVYDITIIGSIGSVRIDRTRGAR